MTDLPPTLMFGEAAEAPDVVARQRSANAPLIADLVRRLDQLAPHTLFTCARGSSDHAATFAKYLFETRLGLPTVSQAPSLASLYDAPFPHMAGQPFLLISQSGRSPDLLLSAEAARRAGAFVIAAVNDTASPLAAAADHVVPLHAGPEKSVAATKSYIATLAALTDIAATWSADRDLADALDRLPADLGAAWDADWAQSPPFVDARNLFVLGRGLTLGIALEAALKFNETTGIFAAAFSIAEVAHGPMALVERDFPILVFPPHDRAAAGTEALIADFAARGADIAVAGGGLPGTRTLPLADGLHPATAPIAMIQAFYRMINAVALARGRNPDRPPSLNKVTETR